MKGHSDHRILAEKGLHHTADPALVKYCPSMDLIALVTTDQQILIYRLNGQRVYGSAKKSDKLRVASIQWKPNGQLLAVAWSDGSICLISPESSKVVHQFSTGSHVSGITCMGWNANTINRSTSSKRRKIGGSLDSTLTNGGDHEALDLPRDLSLIDIEISLPKLSVLAAGGSDEAFSARSSLDALFRPFDPEDNNSVDVMVVGTKEGAIHLSIYDSFAIGSFVLPRIDKPELMLHTSHKQYSTHSLLLRSSVAEKQLYFVSMDLRFISTSSEYLSLLASRSTALQYLLRYINQVQDQMVSEWTSTQELPGRFLGNINETLVEKDSRDIVQALYHSVATGHTIPSVRNWLVDELSERGHKRWDKAVTSGLENLRRLVHENMLPAIERCSLILSRFMGIARFYGADSSLGFTAQQINAIMDIVACLHLVSSKILIQVVDELELFTSFSSWLRSEIDRLASDVSASPTDEASAEKEASLDHSKVLSYIQTVMTSSPLAVYLGKTENFGDSWSHDEHGLSMYDLLDKQLQKQQRGLPYITSLPQVDILCKNITRQASTIFSQIAEAEKRNVLFGNVYEIGPASLDAPMHMRIVAKNKRVCETYIVCVCDGTKNVVQIIRVTLEVENGISSLEEVASACLRLGNGIVKDLKIGDDALFVLWESSDQITSLLNVAYREDPKACSKTHFHYKPHTSSPSPISFSDTEVLRRFSRYDMGSDASFVPGKLEIREGNAGREEERSRRILLLSQDQLRYRMLDLMTSGDAADGDGDADADADADMA